MTANIVHLPRPHQARSGPRPLALFVRVGHNDHREMLDLIATGEQGIFGFIIEAQYVERHRELMTESRRRNFDLILDPKTQPMGLPGGHTARAGGAALGIGASPQHNGLRGCGGTYQNGADSRNGDGERVHANSRPDPSSEWPE